MRPWRIILSVLVPLSVLTAVALSLDVAEVLRRLGATDLRWMAAGLILLWAQTLLSAMRWSVTAAGLRQHLALHLATREYFVAQLGNQLLPGGVAGDAIRAIRTRRSATSTGAALAGVAVERLAGQVFMVAALVLGLVLSFGRAETSAWPPLLRPAILGLVTGAALVLCGAMMARRPRWLGSAGAVLRQGLVANGRLPRQALLGLAIVAVNLAAFACAARAVGVALGSVEVLVVVPLILSAMLIPLGHAGWGWREGAAAGLFPLIAMPAEAGVAASAVFGGLCLISALPGVVWVLDRHGTKVSSPPPAPMRHIGPIAAAFPAVDSAAANETSVAIERV